MTYREAILEKWKTPNAQFTMYEVYEDDFPKLVRIDIHDTLDWTPRRESQLSGYLAVRTGKKWELASCNLSGSYTYQMN